MDQIGKWTPSTVLPCCKSSTFGQHGVGQLLLLAAIYSVTNENIYFEIITMNNVSLRTIHIAYNMLILFITNLLLFKAMDIT